MRLFEPFAGFFRENRWSEGTENFAMLDPAIENFFHLRAARVGHDAAVSQRARSPFGTSLNPAKYFSIRNDGRRFLEQFFFGQFADCTAVFRKTRRLHRRANLNCSRKRRPSLRMEKYLAGS